MATRTTDPVPVVGIVDRAGRLVSADAELERLQVEAGSALGSPLALPQLAALARAAASLGVALSRSVVAADAQHDLDLHVRAEPIDDGVRLTIERWVARPMTPPRLALVDPAEENQRRGADRPTFEFDTDAALKLTGMSPALAALLGVEPSAVLGRPLTSLFRLVEELDGSMPLLSAVASRAPVDGQRAVPRQGGEEERIDADPAFDEHQRFAGFRARLRRDPAADETASTDASAIEESLDEALRSPLARIIAAADQIAGRSDGPLRSDYASYAGDIAAAGRHLLSVIRSMGGSGRAAVEGLDLARLVAEAASLVQPAADQARVTIGFDSSGASISAAGEARAVVQILVNVLGNAVRHSPVGGMVAVAVESRPSECRVTISDDGPGIDPADQQRIFERYERVGTKPDGSGLGLAISRRLARAMGGDIRLDSAPGRGARFMLILPAA